MRQPFRWSCLLFLVLDAIWLRSYVALMDGPTFLVMALFGGLFFGGLSALLGGGRGINAWGCFFMGLFFGPIGLLYAALAPSPYVAPAVTPDLAQTTETEARALEEPPHAPLGVPEAIAKLADLRDRGALTDDEFANAKASLLKRI